MINNRFIYIFIVVSFFKVVTLSAQATYQAEHHIGNDCFEVFKSKKAIPIRLRQGNLYKIDIDNQKVGCFEDRISNVVECILKNAGEVNWHLYKRFTTSFNKDSIPQMLHSILKDIKDTNSDISESISSNSYFKSHFIFCNVSNSSKPNYVNRFKTTKNRKKEPWSDTPPNQQLLGDIDGDGKKELVVWKKFAKQDIGKFYQIYIYQKSGRLLWNTPATTDAKNLYAFGSWKFGDSLPEVLVDIDQDNQTELLAPLASSTTSPVYYRIFGWNGHRLVARHQEVLMCSTKVPNRFIWVNPFPNNGNNRCWVSSMSPGKNSDEVVANIMALNSNKEEIGKAVLKFDAYGAKVKRWIEFLPGYSSINISQPTLSYIARIGEQDHYNSHAQRLFNLNAILHQERANYYKGIRDKEDTSIGRFKTLEEREKIDQMPIEAVNIPLDELTKEVIEGNPILRVTILPDRLRVEKIGK